MTKRLVVFVYGVLSYAVFFLTFLYAVGFIGNIYVPKSMDSGARVPFCRHCSIDTFLLGVFAVQHSMMARPPSRRVLTASSPSRPSAAPMSSLSSLALIALFAYWQRSESSGTLRTLLPQCN